MCCPGVGGAHNRQSKHSTCLPGNGGREVKNADSYVMEGVRYVKEVWTPA